MCRLKPSAQFYRISSCTVVREVYLSPKVIIKALVVLTIVATTVRAKKLPKIEAFFQGE